MTHPSLARIAHRQPTRWCLALCLVLAGCAGSAELRAPQPPSYPSAVAEALALPNQIETKVDWALEPIKTANSLAAQVGAVRDRLAGGGLPPEKFIAACLAALKGQDAREETFEGVTPEVRADAVAFLAQLRTLHRDTKQVPARLRMAGVGIFKLLLTSPKTVARAAQELKSPTGAVNVALTVDPKKIVALPGELRQLSSTLRTKLKSAPKDAAVAVAKLTAAVHLPAVPGSASGSANPAAFAHATDSPALTPVGSPPAFAPERPPTRDSSVTATRDEEEREEQREKEEEPAIRLFGPPSPEEVGEHVPDDLERGRAALLVTKARARRDAGDFMTAAEYFEQAYLLSPESAALALEVAEAALHAGACDRSQAYAAHASARDDRTENDAGAALRLADHDCQDAAAPVVAARVRFLGAEAERIAAANLFGASRLYLDAARLQPNDVALATRALRTLVQAGDCTTAALQLQRFMSDRADGRSMREIAKVVTQCVETPVSTREQAALGLHREGVDSLTRFDYGTAERLLAWSNDLTPGRPEIRVAWARAAWMLGDCATASRALTGREQGVAADDPALAAWAADAKGRIAKLGCPHARWPTSGGATPHIVLASPPPPPSTALLRPSDAGAQPAPTGGSGRPLRTIAWSTLGVGVVSVAGLVSGGTVMARRALAARAVAIDPDSIARANKRYQVGRSLYLTGWIAGTAIVSTGLAMIIVETVRHRKGKAASSRVAASPGGLEVRW